MFRDPEPETVPRECEIGLSVQREMRRSCSVLTAHALVRPLSHDPDSPPALDAAFPPSFHDEGCYAGAALDGFEVSAWYDGRHFYDSGFAYIVHRPLYTAWAQAIAHQLHTIEAGLRERATRAGQGELDRHSYPELVAAIAEIIGVRFAHYRLDTNPDSAFTLTDLPGLSAAFEQHTPRDRSSAPMSF